MLTSIIDCVIQGRWNMGILSVNGLVQITMMNQQQQTVLTFMQPQMWKGRPNALELDNKVI